MVGGGAIGLSVAWRAATEGLAVTVVDPSPGHGASWVAAGMLAPVNEAHYAEHPDLVALHLAGAARWPAFADELEQASGRAVGFQPCGTVTVAVDASDRAVIDALVAFHTGIGLGDRRLSASECRALVPALAPGIRGGSLAPDDHQVDPRAVVAALLAACAEEEVALVADKAAEIVVEGGRATGVLLEDGRVLGADTVVLAAGCWSGTVPGLPAGVVPAVRPVKGHVVRLWGPPDRPLLDRTVRGVVHGHAVYLVPRADGTIVVGATVEERGFDTSLQAGAVHQLLSDAAALVPGTVELELAECIAGLRPGSPDNGPFIGPSRLDGLTIATGHHRNGILLAPVTADAVVAGIVGEPVPPETEPFSARRAPVVAKG